MKLPEFIADLGRPRPSFAALVAGSIALFAAGVDPRVFSAGTPDAQAALRERPQIESLFLVASVAEAAFLLFGGILGDTTSRRRVLIGGLALLAAFEIAAIVFPSGPLFLAARVAAVASVGLVLPVALATVAVAYEGATRATALGIAYAALGAATAVAPALLVAVTPTVGHWPSFVLAAAAALIALTVTWRAVARGEPAGLAPKQVYPHALWALGLLSITAGIIGFRESQGALIRLGLIVGGVVLVVMFLVVQRRRGNAPDDAAIDVRPTTVALVAGIAIAVAQTAPMLEIPLFLQISQRYPALFATLALAPFILATIVAGPVAGILLSRYSPRALICGGLAVCGLADLIMAQARPDTSYLFFIAPFFAVGVGFVVGTSVRTAVIFASTPRRLPATAAALNQTSLVVGGQAAVAGVTALVGASAVAVFAAAQPPGPDAAAAVAEFRSFLVAIGTSEFGQIVGSLSDTTTAAYGAAFAAGVQSALNVVGLATLILAGVCWLAMGKPEPVDTVFDLREER